MTRRRVTEFLLGCLCALTAGCQTELDSPVTEGPRKVSLALNWFPEAEHGGFYAAAVHGFFAEVGLEVEILPGGPGAPVIQQVAGGQVDFAVANADQVLLGRDQQAPVVAVMTALQHSPRCIMVHRSSGIKRLQDLNHLTLSLGVGKPFARFLLQQLGDASLEIIPYQGSVTMFLQREDFAQQAYVFSEPYVAEKMGGDPHCLMLSELGFDPYTSLLVTSESFVEENEAVVQSMVRACVRGWQKYLDDPTETNRRIYDLNPEMDLDILAFGAAALRPLCDDESSELGKMSGERWQTLAGQLSEIELLENADVWTNAYDLRFVP